MARMTVQMPGKLHEKARRLAAKHDLSLSEFLTGCLSTGIVRDKTREMMQERKRSKRAERLSERIGEFLSKTQPGDEPTVEEIEQAVREE